MTDPEHPADQAPFLALLAKIKPQIDRRVERALDRELRRHQRSGVEVVSMLTEAKALSARGGKRLRAALVVVGERALASERRAPKVASRAALECGVALELLQSYFLIHDDWMDRDDIRRGGPAVHAALARRFESEHKGAAAAVLAGDYLVALATAHLVSSLGSHEELPRLLDGFTQMQLAAVAGQALDVIGLTRQAEQVYALKTASYTVAGPLQLGAVLAGATPARLKRLRAFSEPLGVAFQLRDDLLGAFGDPEITGKPRGNDLVQGKWTWTVEWALAHGKPRERSALSRVLGNSAATPAELTRATEALISSGARAASEARIAELALEAQRALRRLELSPRGNELLGGVMTALCERQS